MRCPACGALIKAEDESCADCGLALNREAPEPLAKNEPADSDAQPPAHGRWQMFGSTSWQIKPQDSVPAEQPTDDPQSTRGVRPAVFFLAIVLALLLFLLSLKLPH